MDLYPLLHPVGPQPPGIYWRRRFVVLLGVLVVLWILNGLANAVFGGGSGGHPAASPSPTPSATATTTPTPTPTPTATADATPAALPVCADSSLQVSVAADAASYKPGVEPHITVTIRNVSEVTCRRDLGPAARSVTIRSGNDRIFSSADCATPVKQLVRIVAGGEQTTTIVWGRHRSTRGCPSAAPVDALPGTYRVFAEVGSITVEGAPFRLTSS